MPDKVTRRGLLEFRATVLAEHSVRWVLGLALSAKPERPTGSGYRKGFRPARIEVELVSVLTLEP